MQCDALGARVSCLLTETGSIPVHCARTAAKAGVQAPIWVHAEDSFPPLQGETISERYPWIH
jgi:hypothetical protein